MATRLFLLLWGILLLASIGTAEEGDQEQLRIQQQKRQQLQQSISRLQESIRKTRREKDSLTAELADSEREIGSLIAQLRQLDAQQLLLQENLRDLQRQQQELQRHLAASRNKLGQLLRSAYMAGRQERLKLFLNQQDPALLSRLLAYHDYISRERARQLQLLSQNMKKNRALAIQIEQQQTSLDQSRKQQQTKKESLQQHQAQRRHLLQLVDSRLQQQDQKLARWQEDERQLANLLKDLQHQFRGLDLPEQKGFQESKGKLIWPLSGKLLKGFDTHKIGNLRWDGVIIGAREGEEVRTVHAGRVAWADWLRGYGLLIIVEHGDGFMSLYGNNQSLFKETGDWVEAGEVIAQASGGGGRTKSGVYFGIRYQGKALNPARWCTKSHRR
jgi:septal ring factor EnvC (AmiA/AmiB activator)